MKKLFVSLLLPLLSVGAWSQDVIYRCGNEYTNNVSPVSYTHLTLPTTPYV